MRRTYLIITALFGTSCMLNAQQTTGVIADNLKIERNGEYMVVDMNMNLSRLDVESNRAVLLTPRFISTVDTGTSFSRRLWASALLLLCTEW